MIRVIRACATATLATGFALLTGCSSTPSVERVNTPGAAFQGHVQGGQQPVTGSTLQLYAVGTTGDAATATPLLNRTVTTSDGSNTNDSNANAGNNNNALPAGAFTITGDYTCPAGTTEVYLVATGGNPGLGSGTNNKAISMMAALGQCGQLGSSTYVFVDEVTTVGSIAALYPYMTGYATVGSGTSDAAAFASAFSQVNEFTNTSTGLAPGAALPAGYYASSTEINTLADIVAACINSAGGTAGDGTACGTLFNLTKPTGGTAATDVVSSLVQLLKNPAQNTAAIFNIGTSFGPFQPTLTSAPSTWSLLIVPMPGTPTFSPAAGAYVGSQSVTISDSDPSAVIYYTTNGTTPTTSSTVYSGAFTVSSSETVEALAVESSRASSAVGSAAYTITSAGTIPVITSVSAVAAQQTQTITITGSGFGTLAAYTGTSNDISLIDATKGFQAGYGYDTVTLVVSSWTNSQIVLQGFSGAYGQGTYYLSSGDAINLTIYNAQRGSGPGACNNIVVGAGATTCSAGQTPAPAFSVSGGSYAAAQLVSLSDAVSGASIYYTTNGATPTSASTPYTAPITVSSSETIEAIAVATGYTTSNVASATYTITSYGIMSTFAGTGVSGYSGDGGPATSAELVSPYAVAIDSAGNIYTADYGGNRVRKITPAGIISTFAGTGAGSSTGDGGLATSATLNGPNGVALDSAGNVYIGEEHGARVRKVTTAGIISTVAGNGTQGYSGDGGPATSAELTDPENITVDSSGNLYIADTYGNRIRKVNTSGTISTFAGTGTAGYNGDNIAATSAQLSAPYDVITDTSGNVYISDTNNNRVRKVSASGIITTIAGTGTASFGGDGGAATSAYINGAIQISMDTSGNLYIADQSNHRIRKVNSSGIISTIAGNGVNGYSGDGGPALNAEMKNVEGVVTDPSGNVYIGDGGNSVLRKITYQATAPAVATPTFALGANGHDSTETLSDTTAGASIYYTLDGSTPTTSSTLYTATLVVTATFAPTITINAIAVAPGYTPSAVATTSVTYSPAPAPTFSVPGGSYTSTQTVSVSDTATFPKIYYTLDGSTPTASSPTIAGPITVSSSETIKAVAVGEYDSASPVASATYTITPTVATPTFTPAGGTYTSIQEVTISSATAGATIYYTIDGSTPTTSSNQYYGPFPVSTSETLRAIAVATGYANSAIGSAVYVINLPPAGTVTFSPAGGTYTTAQFVTLNVTASGGYNVYYTTDGSTPTTNSTQYGGAPIVVSSSETINVLLTSYYYASVTASASYVINLTHGLIVTVAGNGAAGYNGDGSPATSYELNQTYGIAADGKGDIFIADNSNNRIRYLTPGGAISTVAGNGTPGSSGNPGPATSAELFIPWNVSVDSYGDFYIADTGHDRIVEVNGVSSDYLQAIYGTGSVGSLSAADGVLVDAKGNVYIAEAAQIIKYSNVGVVSVIAGTGVKGYNGEGTATSAQISIPIGMALDSNGNLYFADQDNNRVRKVTPAGVISTIAGTGTAGYNGEGTATSAELNYPFGIAVDAAGNVYIADQGNSRIRKVTVATGIISTVAGNGSVGFAGDGGQATSATLSGALGIAIDPAGNLFIADKNRIRRVTP
jgi:hypothetical protein